MVFLIIDNPLVICNKLKQIDMKLERNIEKILRIALEKREENKTFRQLLQKQNANYVDALVNQLNDTIAAQIDCLECGNCCHNIRPIASDKVLINYVEPENIEKYKYSMGFACKNLDGNKCIIYSERYDECRMFPYLYRADFVLRLPGVLQNYEICPIVFNVVEQLKIKILKT